MLKIHSDGEVEYVGKDFVEVKGRRTSRIARSDFSKLVRKIQRIRFFQLNERYDRYPLGESTTVMGQPTEIVSVTVANRTKTVEDYMGAPKELYELEKLILDVTHVSNWTGDSDDLWDFPYYDSFPLNRRATFRALLEHYATGDSPTR